MTRPALTNATWERTVIELEIPAEWWMTSNRRLHHHDKRRRTANIRQKAGMLERSRGPVPTPVKVTATISLPTNRRFDPPNAWPVVKAALDGLVDAGILPDDDHAHVPTTVFERGPKTPGKYTLTLTLERIGTRS